MKAILLSALILFSFSGFSQSAKKARQHKIKTTKIVKTIDVDGQKHSFTETIEVFDKNGKTLSKTEYSKSGKIKREQTYKYDNFGNVSEETDRKVKDGTHFVYKYKYDGNGDKISKTQHDINGNLIENSSYKYDNRGLRIEKIEHDGAGKLKSVRKTTYEYF